MANDPTGVVLPDLVYNPKTRVSGEFYLYYNLQPAYYHGVIGMTDDGAQGRAETPCASSPVVPSGFAVVRARTALKAGASSTWNGGILPAYAPPGQSAEATSTAIPGTVTGAAVGDGVDVITLPHPAGDVLICFDQGFSAEAGDENRPIPRKFNPADHYVRQRPENTINLSDLLVCNLQGLARLRQRDCTLIGYFYPDGGAVASEIIYYTNVRLNIPKDVPEDANESVRVNATGTFRDELVFSARP